MRILLISPMIPEASGTGAIPVLLHAQLVGLSERHEVTLVAGMGDEPGEAQAAEALRRAGVDLHVADRRRPPPGLQRWRRRGHLAARWARGPWPWRTVWFCTDSVQRQVDRLVVGRRFDVIDVEDNSMAAIRLPADTPSVLTEHEVRRPRPVEWRPGVPGDWPGWAFRELDWRRWKAFQRTAWKRFARLQAFSASDADAMESLVPEVAGRVRVNPFGLVPPPLCDPKREVPGTVLFVGNFTHPPNRDAASWLAREIMPAIRLREPAARLRIVGSAPPSEVMELAGPQVDVFADAPSVKPHLDAACVVLAPVRTGGGMRMKVLHAMASGKAVVTTRRGAEGYIGPHRVPPLVLADDAKGLAAAASEILGDERRRLELADRGRAFALEHHSPGAWASRLEAVYVEALDDRGEQGG
jgi:polysaccharide biosynthesis protein PslH